MIDQIKLILKEYFINSDNKFKLISCIDMESGQLTHNFPLWENEKGQTTYGKKAYYNDPNGKFNVDIQYYELYSNVVDDLKI